MRMVLDVFVFNYPCGDKLQVKTEDLINKKMALSS